MNATPMLLAMTILAMTGTACGSASSDTAEGTPASSEAASGSVEMEGGRNFDLSWTILVEEIPEGTEAATLWIAVPPDLEMQTVSSLDVATPYPWDMVEDPDFHNRTVRVSVADPPDRLAVTLSARVTRDPVEGPVPAVLSAADRDLFLREEALVSLSPRLRALADSVGGDSRTRYDYVLGLMTYDKTVPGWGNGDSERACDVRFGNCTDFHSLFMSLSRAEGVPTVFEMGYPTLPDGETDRVGGYHCWAYFYDEAAAGWVPVDISEADRHPEKTEFFYGHLDPDRITFSRGRDIRLPGMAGEPLNYLPAGAYVEVDGRPHGKVTRNLSYRVSEERAE